MGRLIAYFMFAYFAVKVRIKMLTGNSFWNYIADLDRAVTLKNMIKRIGPYGATD